MQRGGGTGLQVMEKVEEEKSALSCCKERAEHKVPTPRNTWEKSLEAQAGPRTEAGQGMSWPLLLEREQKKRQERA